jgi:hypothetical protein
MKQVKIRTGGAYATSALTPVDAFLVDGALAVTQASDTFFTVSPTYVVTHVPTGLAVPGLLGFSSVTMAASALRLVQQVGDWSFTDYTTLNTLASGHREMLKGALLAIKEMFP